MSSFSTYLIGYFIFVIGLAVAAVMLNVPTIWVGIGVLVLIGVGIMMATRREKPRDPPNIG
jgi:uncharacterized membrane protein YiaA